MTKFSCVGCAAKCCKGTVFISGPDHHRILTFAEQNQAEFDSYLKTKLVAHFPNMRPPLVVQPALLDKPWPSKLNTFYVTPEGLHSTKPRFDPVSESLTSCIFLTDTGTCFLQDVAVRQGFHKWHLKPLNCIAFPLVFEHVHGDQGRYVLINDSRASGRDIEHYRRLVEDSACKSSTYDDMTEAYHFLVSAVSERKEAFQAANMTADSGGTLRGRLLTRISRYISPKHH